MTFSRLKIHLLGPFLLALGGCASAPIQGGDVERSATLVQGALAAEAEIYAPCRAQVRSRPGRTGEGSACCSAMPSARRRFAAQAEADAELAMARGTRRQAAGTGRRAGARECKIACRTARSRLMSVLACVPLAVILLGGLVACSSTPKRDLEFERIDQELRAFESDPELGGLAPAEAARVRALLMQMQTPGLHSEGPRQSVLPCRAASRWRDRSGQCSR